MCATLEVIGEKVLRVCLEGMLSKAEIDAVQASFVERYTEAETDRVVVILDGFLGWKEDADWGDISFLWEYGDKVVKMAIVGDPKLENQLLMFTGAGFRFTEISFFPLEAMSQAMEWLQ